MNTNDFISDVLDMLSESITYAPIWSRNDVLGYLRKTLKRFSELTFIIDRDSLRYVDGTTGESIVPSKFISPYYMMYDKVQLDIVQLGELDFVSETWSLGTTGASPLASSVMGIGKDAVIRVAPVPTNTLGPFGYDVAMSVTLSDSGGSLWDMGVDANGVLSMTAALAGTTRALVLSGPTTLWDVTVNLVGVLSTAASAATTSTTVYLTDPTGGQWNVTVNDSGVLETFGGFGKLVRLEVDGVNQDFTSNYGTASNTYAYGTASTPSFISRLDSPFGVITMGRVSDRTLHTWYKALIDDTPNTNSEIYLNDCFIPIIQHGVLALAYDAETAGRDSNKAKVLDAIFKIECDSVRRIFNRK